MQQANSSVNVNVSADSVRKTLSYRLKLKINIKSLTSEWIPTRDKTFPSVHTTTYISHASTVKKHVKKAIVLSERRKGS